MPNLMKEDQGEEAVNKAHPHVVREPGGIMDRSSHRSDMDHHLRVLPHLQKVAPG